MHYVHAKTLLSAQNGMNLYRGCTHGCIYCDSRSVCYHIDHAFEDIEVKQNALVLLAGSGTAEKDQRAGQSRGADDPDHLGRRALPHS